MIYLAFTHLLRRFGPESLRREAALALAEYYIARAFDSLPKGPEKYELAQFITACSWFTEIGKVDRGTS